MTIAPLYSNLTEHRQGYDHDYLFEMVGQPVRVQVHHDTFYPFQSSATAHVWTPAPTGGGQWNLIASYAPMAWADDKAKDDGATGGLWAACAELEARARYLLTPREEVVISGR